jgi:hypothetical protein
MEKRELIQSDLIKYTSKKKKGVYASTYLVTS